MTNLDYILLIMRVNAKKKKLKFQTLAKTLLHFSSFKS